MIKWLVFVRPNFRGNRLVPFLSVAEGWIDVEDDPAEWKQSVPHHLSDLIFGVANLVHGCGNSKPVRRHARHDNPMTQLWQATDRTLNARSWHDSWFFS
jgi:hypothetical protein